MPSLLKGMMTSTSMYNRGSSAQKSPSTYFQSISALTITAKSSVRGHWLAIRSSIDISSRNQNQKETKDDGNDQGTHRENSRIIFLKVVGGPGTGGKYLFCQLENVREMRHNREPHCCISALWRAASRMARIFTKGSVKRLMDASRLCYV